MKNLRELEKHVTKNKRTNLYKVYRDNKEELTFIDSLRVYIKSSKKIQERILKNFNIPKNSYLLIGGFYVVSRGGFQGRRGTPYYLGLVVKWDTEREDHLTFQEKSGGVYVPTKKIQEYLLREILEKSIARNKILDKESHFLYLEYNKDILHNELSELWKEYCNIFEICPDCGYPYVDHIVGHEGTCSETL